MDTGFKPDFRIGQMVDDLVVITIDLCIKDLCYKKNKSEAPPSNTKNPRFPSFLRDNYVQRIMATVLDVQENVFIANGTRDTTRRKELQEISAAKCEYLLHLERIAYDKKWISDKQFARWAELTTKLKWKIVEWCKATKT